MMDWSASAYLDIRAPKSLWASARDAASAVCWNALVPTLSIAETSVSSCSLARLASILGCGWLLLDWEIRSPSYYTGSQKLGHKWICARIFEVTVLLVFFVEVNNTILDSSEHSPFPLHVQRRIPKAGNVKFRKGGRIDAIGTSSVGITIVL
jgi:hypothetical protein